MTLGGGARGQHVCHTPAKWITVSRNGTGRHVAGVALSASEKPATPKT
jgi:hypothetical protein